MCERGRQNSKERQKERKKREASVGETGLEREREKEPTQDMINNQFCGTDR